jgi:cold shock CspA family protein
MGRSQETFGKKEREKKRLAKKREKQEKKDERKTTSGKGKGLDDMIAYVDEHGNITDTPPDPNNKIEVNLDDIMLGAAKIEDSEPVDPTRTGLITYFNSSKGYGFIRDIDTKESVFVHVNQLNGPLAENTRVTFETEKSARGLTAVNVKVI